ncbi:MAG TPA: dihydrodipicolinate synthase family protein [Verrucomicrobiales bacterium]|nr:dihydrodipicolinate synthase family protein [Verrucomicrobiales bacterium]
MTAPRPAIDELRDRLRSGLVIPAHPLVLTAAGKLDERRQRALTRYYHAAGAGGIAVGVHTTQFAIREPQHDLLNPVLALAAETAAACDRAASRRTMRIAGICGDTRQATSEATLAQELGFDAGLLSLGALREADNERLAAHCRAVGEIMPLVGFYLQPAAGGRLLSPEFWRRFAEIPNVVGIKIAPFNRYQTLDVLRAVAESGRANDIALYTGNDDNIVVDLITEHEFATAGGVVKLHFAGGLLGHWACWTRRAVELLRECRQARESGSIPGELLTRAAQVTEANAALFDAANGFAGCIPGIHHVLQRQGLLATSRCLDPGEILSPGQADAIEGIRHQHSWMLDDEFVASHLEDWLK